MGFSSAIYAHAQFKLDSVTPPRYNTDGVKSNAPCGSAANWASYRTNRKGIFISGETVTVEWIETVQHPGSYKFDFAPANDQEFENNQIMTVPDTQDGSASRENPHYYSQAIQLNFSPCEACTLRMRQDMDNAENFYFSCADIVIVSGNDITPPQEVTALTASSEPNGVQLTWTNPADIKGIIVLRNTVPISNQPAVRQDYLVDDTIGNAVVVYKGTGTSFTDNSVATTTEYTYKVFAYDADYNYNSGVSQTITAVESDTNPDGGANEGSENFGQTDGYGSSGGGAGSWALILLATLLIFQRPAWKKLL
jgi:hypothetical protein